MVANLSLSGGINKALNDAIDKAVKAGVIVVGAAGNNNGRDACSYSPGSSSAIIVGSIDESGGVSDFSNRGRYVYLPTNRTLNSTITNSLLHSCVDSWAPGRNIKSLGKSGSDTAIYRGTSMAAPHVAGAAALCLEAGVSPNKLANGKTLSVTLIALESPLSTTSAPMQLRGSTSPPTISPSQAPTKNSGTKCIPKGKSCSITSDTCCGKSKCQSVWSWTKGQHETCRVPSIWDG